MRSTKDSPLRPRQPQPADTRTAGQKRADHRAENRKLANAAFKEQQRIVRQEARGHRLVKITRKTFEVPGGKAELVNKKVPLVTETGTGEHYTHTDYE